MTRKIVVIGSNSFSASDFIDLLLEDSKNDVIGISRSPEKNYIFLPYKRHQNPKFSFYQFDLNKDYQEIFTLFTKEKPQYIVNYAAQSEVAPSWEHPEQWFETNAVSLARLANFLKDFKPLRRYIHISSPEVYGSCKGRVTEDAPVNPSTPYAASKAAGDLFLLTLFKNYNFPVSFIRSTNVYGAHQQLFKIIPRSIIYIKLGKTVELHGGGKAIKSYIHIRDVSRGILAVLDKGKSGQIYHLSPKKGIKVADVVKLICKMLDTDFSKATKVVAERIGQDKAYVIDSTLARQTLGWQPEISIEDGIAGVINWINNNWQTIKNMPLVYVHKP